MDRISVVGIVPGVEPQTLAAAFLDARQHAAMTGAGATVDGDAFTAWDGYITGRTLSVGPPIVQAWRTADFPDEAPDSRLEIHLRAVAGGTEVRFEHGDIPPGQGPSYQQGWQDYYLEPMRAWFGRS